MSEQLSKPERKPFSIDKDNLASFMKAVIYGSVVILLIVLAVYFSNFHSGVSDKQEVWGAFGDFVGGVLNPIFGLFGLIALLMTITLQTKELEATHIELRRSAHAQELMEKTAKEQAITMERQRFETTFFALLDQHKQSFNYFKDPPTAQGGLSLSRFENLHRHIFDQQSLVQAKSELANLFEYASEYYNSLYQVLKFIALNSANNTGVSFDIADIQSVAITQSEKMYSDIVQSSVTNNAAQMLMVLCSTNEESNQWWTFKLLIERYELLSRVSLYNDGSDSIVLEAANFFESFSIRNPLNNK